MTPTPYPDDPTIGNDAILWRRIHPLWIVAYSASAARFNSAAPRWSAAITGRAPIRFRSTAATDTAATDSVATPATTGRTGPG